MSKRLPEMGGLAAPDNLLTTPVNPDAEARSSEGYKVIVNDWRTGVAIIVAAVRSIWNSTAIQKNGESAVATMRQAAMTLVITIVPTEPIFPAINEAIQTLPAESR